MKALWIEQHGPPATLRLSDVPEPPLGPGEVRVEIHAAAINPSDVLSAEGRFPHALLPRILGRDFAIAYAREGAKYHDSSRRPVHARSEVTATG